MTPDFITQCTQILGNFRSTGDADEFYSSFYASIADHSTNYFPGLVFPACTTLCIKVADKLAAVSRLEIGKEADTRKEMSKLEIDALQYLAGYIIKNLRQKATRLKYEPDMNEIFEAFVELNPVNQTLLVAKNRGGLTAVNDEGQKLFLAVEKRFRHLFESRSIASMNIKEEVENIAVDPFVVNCLTKF